MFLTTVGTADRTPWLCRSGGLARNRLRASAGAQTIVARAIPLRVLRVIPSPSLAALENGGVKRIYLDQNHWVSLARAARGHPAGDPYKDILTLINKAVDLRTVSFPLSSQHYYEIHQQRDLRRRNDLAGTGHLQSSLRD
jgi:hypothetical protein